MFAGANVIQTGDVFFNGMFPFIDLDNGGRSMDLSRPSDRIIETADTETKIIPGHGAIASSSDLEATRRSARCRSAVKALVDAGKSEDEIVAENPLSDYHERTTGNS